MKGEQFQAVRGMNDVIPGVSEQWAFLEEEIRQWLRAYAYREVRFPVVEPTGLFVRSIGTATDIVEKEMYSFVDSLNGEALTLRPEGTASCARLVIQHHLLHAGPQRLWYMGPMFRHERPQKGRYRQFHQCGVEAMGFAGPEMDAELILMTARLWQRLGLSDVSLHLNTIGSSATRARYRTRLQTYFSAHADRLDEDSRRRLTTNPLRILDSKNPAMTELIENAPRLMDDLDEESRVHFETLQGLLQQNGVAYRIDPRLVRGLDYYNATVFEWMTPLLGAQSTICGGGRYDGLLEQLGGETCPGLWFCPWNGAAPGFAGTATALGAAIRRSSRGVCHAPAAGSLGPARGRDAAFLRVGRALSCGRRKFQGPAQACRRQWCGVGHHSGRRGGGAPEGFAQAVAWSGCPVDTGCHGSDPTNQVK